MLVKQMLDEWLSYYRNMQLKEIGQKIELTQEIETGDESLVVPEFETSRSSTNNNSESVDAIVAVIQTTNSPSTFDNQVNVNDDEDEGDDEDDDDDDDDDDDEDDDEDDDDDNEDCAQHIYCEEINVDEV